MIEKIGKIIEYIEKNYHESLNNEIIEKVTQVSEGHLRNEFSRVEVKND